MSWRGPLAALALLAAPGCVEPPNQLSGPEAFPVAMAAATEQGGDLFIVLTERPFKGPILNDADQGRMLQFTVAGYHRGWGSYPVTFDDTTLPHPGETIATLWPVHTSRSEPRAGMSGRLDLIEVPDGGLQGWFAMTFGGPDGGDPRELSGRFAAERTPELGTDRELR